MGPLCWLEAALECRASQPLGGHPRGWKDLEVRASPRGCEFTVPRKGLPGSF